MQRLGAVVPDPHGDAGVVEELTHVVRMHSGHIDADQAEPVDARTLAEQAHPGNLQHAAHQALAELGVPRGDAAHAGLREVVHGRGQGDGLRDALGAGLESLRRRQELGFVHVHGRDHRAAGEERRHGREQLPAAEQRTDAGGAEHLVAGEHGEVHAEGVQVHRDVRHTLAGVEHGERSHRRREGHELGDRAERTGDVGSVREGEHAGAGGHDAAGGRHVEKAGIRYRNEPQRGAGAQRQLLPRNEVGVVLQLGDHDLVAGSEGEAAGVGAAEAEGGVGEAVGEQVDGFGGVAGPDDLVGRGPDERGHLLAGALVDLGGLDGQGVRAAVHGGVALLVELLLGFHHADRVLRGGTGIEVVERVPVHLLGEHRKVVADAFHLPCGQRPGGTVRGRGRRCVRDCKTRHEPSVFLLSATVTRGDPCTPSREYPRRAPQARAFSGTSSAPRRARGMVPSLPDPAGAPVQVGSALRTAKLHDGPATCSA